MKMATFPEDLSEPIVQTLAADLEKTLCRHIEELLGEKDWEHVQIRDTVVVASNDNVFKLSRSINLGSLSQKYDEVPYLHIREVLIPSLFEEFYRGFEEIVYGFDPDQGLNYFISRPRVQAAIRPDTWETIFEIQFEYREWKKPEPVANHYQPSIF